MLFSLFEGCRDIHLFGSTCACILLVISVDFSVSSSYYVMCSYIMLSKILLYFAFTKYEMAGMLTKTNIWCYSLI